MLHNERDKSYIYDILKYSQEIIDIVKDENHLSRDFMQENQDIPWTKIIGLRNKIVHDYGEILTDRIWLIASESIPELMQQIKSKNFI